MVNLNIFHLKRFTLSVYFMTNILRYIVYSFTILLLQMQNESLEDEQNEETDIDKYFAGSVVFQ